MASQINQHTIDAAKRHLAPNEQLESWTNSTQDHSLIVNGSDSVNGSVSVKKVCKQDGTIIKSTQFQDNVDRVPLSNFKSEWGDDLPVSPTVLLGCCDDWICFSDEKRWDVKSLSLRFPDSVVSLDGGPGFARMSMADGRASMSEYCRYCNQEAREDKAPLYVFDYKMLQPSTVMGQTLQSEYKTPSIFTHDIMSGCTGSTFRPLPPQWMLIGVERSGTPIHDHPCTVAWNVLLSGCKLWMLFPPDIDESVLLLKDHDTSYDSDAIGKDTQLKSDVSEDEDDEDDDFDLSALEWFIDCKSTHPTAKVIVQHPKEVVFVPAGWWHVVLNVETSVGLSNSLALRRDLNEVFADLVESDSDFAQYWANSMVASGYITEETKDKLMKSM